MQLPTTYVILGLIALPTFLAGMYLQQVAKTWLQSYKLKRRFARGARAEVLAAKLLKKSGYTILREQASLTWRVLLQDKWVPVEMRADYLVSKSGKRFIAEVKSGKSAPRIETASTRRQLLEYRLAYNVDGVLLVDMEAEKILDVEFDLSNFEKSSYGTIKRLGSFLLASLYGAIIALASYYVLFLT